MAGVVVVPFINHINCRNCVRSRICSWLHKVWVHFILKKLSTRSVHITGIFACPSHPIIVLSSSSCLIVPVSILSLPIIVCKNLNETWTHEHMLLDVSSLLPSTLHAISKYAQDAYVGWLQRPLLRLLMIGETQSGWSTKLRCRCLGR